MQYKQRLFSVHRVSLCLLNCNNSFVCMLMMLMKWTGDGNSQSAKVQLWRKQFYQSRWWFWRQWGHCSLLVAAACCNAYFTGVPKDSRSPCLFWPKNWERNRKRKGLSGVVILLLLHVLESKQPSHVYREGKKCNREESDEQEKRKKIALNLMCVELENGPIYFCCLHEERN